MYYSTNWKGCKMTGRFSLKNNRLLCDGEELGRGVDAVNGKTCVDWLNAHKELMAGLKEAASALAGSSLELFRCADRRSTHIQTEKSKAIAAHYKHKQKEIENLLAKIDGGK